MRSSGMFVPAAAGQIALGRGQYAEAIAALESVRSASSRWADAQTFAGDAHWKLGLSLRDKGQEAAADAFDAKIFTGPPGKTAYACFVRH